MNKNINNKPLDLFSLQSCLDNNQTIFSYKQLCEILNQPIVPSGAMRNKQIAFWSNFFDISLSGRKWTVSCIYEIPLMTLYTNSTYSEFYDISMYIILSLLLNQVKDSDVFIDDDGHIEYSKNPTLLISKTSLAFKLGFINFNFRRYFGKYSSLASHLNNIDDNNHFSPKEIEKFYQRTLDNYSSIIDSFLTSMEKQLLIIADVVTSGGKKNEPDLIPLTDEQKDILTNLNTDTFNEIRDIIVSSEDEHILTISRKKIDNLKEKYNIEIDKSWGTPSSIDNPFFGSFELFPDVFKYGLQHDFYQIRNEKIKEQLQFDYICKSYQITLNASYCNKVLEKLQEKIDNMKTQFNISSIVKLNNVQYSSRRKQQYSDYVNSNKNKAYVHAANKDILIDTNSKLIDFLISL